MTKTIAYLRVSTDKQDAENQRYEVDRFAESSGISVDEYISETVTGKKDVRDKKIWTAMQGLKQGDTLIMTEISRVGRNMMHLYKFMDFCFENKISVHFIKNNLKLKDDPHSKFMVSALAFAAEIERELISSRTKEALALRKKQGKQLGRKKGFSPGRKLDGKEEEIMLMLQQGTTKTRVAQLMKCSRTTLNNFLH